MILNPFGGIAHQTVSGFLPQIIVTAKTGSIVTCIKDSTILTVEEVEGVWVFNIPDYGAWTVTATDGTRTVEKVIIVNTVAQYNINLPFGLWLYNGSFGTSNERECTDITGGWNATGIGSTSFWSATKNSDHIYMKVQNHNEYQAYISTKSKISTGEFFKLKMIADVHRVDGSYGGPGLFTMEFKSTSNRSEYYFGNAISFPVNGEFEEKEFSWAVSNQNNYLLIGLTPENMVGYCEVKIKKIWLE